MRAITPVYTNPLSFFGDFEKELNGLVGSRRERAFDEKYAAKETEDAWLMAFDLPGTRSENLNIEFENGVIKIEGNRDGLFGEEKGAIFSKSVGIPENVDIEKIEARLELGVLTLSLPKSQKAKAKKIPIMN